jgi:hypothetical protein
MLSNDSLIYLFVYVFVAICALLDSIIKDKPVKLALLLASGATVVSLIALRWNIGTDWDAYHQYFLANVSGGVDESELVDHFDVGYRYLNALVALTTRDYTVFLLITTLLSTGVVCYLLGKHTDHPSIGFFVFLCSYVPIHFTGSIRRSIAISFAMLSVFAYLKVKSGFASYFYMVASFAFHKTSLAAIPILFLKPIPWRTSIVFMFLLGTAFLGLINTSEFVLLKIGEVAPKDSEIGLLITIANYSGEYYKLHTPDDLDPFRQSALSLVKKYIFLYFLYKAAKNIKTHSSADVVLYKIYLIGVCIYSVFIGAPLIQIISTYYLVFEVFLAANFFGYLNNIHKIMFVTFLASSGFLSFDSGLSVYSDLFFPYKSIF